MPKSKPPEPPSVDLVDLSYQPSQKEMKEPIELPADLAALPLPQRLEEAARRLLTTVKIRRVDRPR